MSCNIMDVKLTENTEIWQPIRCPIRIAFWFGRFTLPFWCYCLIKKKRKNIAANIFLCFVCVCLVYSTYSLMNFLPPGARTGWLAYGTIQERCFIEGMQAWPYEGIAPPISIYFLIHPFFDRLPAVCPTELKLTLLPLILMTLLENDSSWSVYIFSYVWLSDSMMMTDAVWLSDSMMMTDAVLMTGTRP